MTLQELGLLLNKDLVRAVYAKVVEAERDPYLSFVLAWIILNHLYATYCDHEPPPSGARGDEKGLLHFAAHPEVVRARQSVLDRKAGKASVHLPVTKRGRDGGRRNVPDNTPRTVLAAALSCEDHFKVIYAIRNNVMHGSKAPITPTDRDNIVFAAIQTRDLIERLASEARLQLR